ncbi:MAG: hypothetical protein FWG30_09820 [Eubacteriaceae bacterium]|nr:hypothetical protein [Eubacteriaceae bacterium]
MGFNEFAALLEKIVPDVFAVCYSLTGDYFESESITQKVFEKAYSKRESMSKLKPPEIRNQLIAKGAEKSAKYLSGNVYSKRAQALSGHPSAATFEDAYKSTKRTAGILPMLTKLPADEYKAAYSYYIVGESVAKRAKSNGISAKEAQKQLDVARGIMRELLLNFNSPASSSYSAAE